MSEQDSSDLSATSFSDVTRDSCKLTDLDNLGVNSLSLSPPTPPLVTRGHERSQERGVGVEAQIIRDLKLVAPGVCASLRVCLHFSWEVSVPVQADRLVLALLKLAC